MLFDFEEMSYASCYRLLVNSIVPRPIALVTSINNQAEVNAAPFSFFNVMGHDPPIIVLGIERREEGGLKDTAANIRATHEFVVNLVSEEMAGPMAACSQPVPPDVSELDLAGLAPAPSVKVHPPRISVSPASFECRELMSIGIGDGRTLIVGRIVAMHLQSHFYDEATDHILTSEMHLIGRMHGSSWYTRTSDLFFVPRPGVDIDKFRQD